MNNIKPINMKPIFKQFLIPLLGTVLLLAPAANGLSHVTGFGPVLSFFVLLALAVAAYLVLPNDGSRRGAHVASVDVEIWANYIIERLWKDNQFLKHAWNDDQYVLKGKIVHIPQPGAAPNISVNRSSFPATAVQRVDTDITYTLNEYTTDPTFIEYSEEAIVSYDKINSIIGDLMGYLMQNVADNMLLSWVDESVTVPTKIYTSGGSAAASTDSIGTALTGNRNVMLANDIKRAALTMNLQNIPKQGRYAIIEANMYDQLLTDLAQTQYRDFSQTADPQKGIVGQLYGFTLLDRSSTVTYSSTGALNPYGATSETTDLLASIFWQENCVSRALGEVKVFEDADRPEYYGDIISTLLRMGGRRRRGDDCGVVALLQGPLGA
jgi:hypothetical protein